MFTNEQYRVSTQTNQKRYIKIQLMNWKEEVIDELEGLALDGNIDIDANSLIRRNCNITFVVNDYNMIPSENSKIWLDKKFRLFVGIESELTGEIVWFDKGIYILNKPSLKYSATIKELSIAGLDKFCWLDGTLNGKLQHITPIRAGTPLFEAVRNLVILGEENPNKILITDVDDFKIPYDIEKGETDTIGSFLAEIKDLYMGFEMFFNEKGEFVFQAIKDRKNDPIVFNFDEVPFILDYANEPNWENVQNDIWVWGQELEDGTQIQYHIQNNNEGSPFSIPILKQIKKGSYKDDKIQTKQQAKMKGKYELFKHSNLNEKISFSSVPIYGLDANNLITVNQEEIGIEGRHKIEKISLPLEVDKSMSISATKMYYDYADWLTWDVHIQDKELNKTDIIDLNDSLWIPNTKENKVVNFKLSKEEPTDDSIWVNNNERK